ncbi:MAG: dephospho-CoA kinase [Firmicutes bacterium]|nr:dephospho-CoA kinase [Bacillota bacterium]
MSTMSKKKIIGLTGSMGAGKSQVSYFIQKEFPVLDCDRVNAQLIEPGHEGFEILKEKGLIHVLADGQMDKAKLAKDMFTDPEIKKEVEGILHPLIFKKVEEWVESQTSEMVFVEVPLLFEIHSESHYDEIWCVVASEEVSLYRLEAYRHISKEEAKRRWANQWSVSDKIKKSDVVIENNGTLEELEEKVKELLRKE